MKIKTEQHYSNAWVAVDDDTYDGPGSPLGSGKTEQEAVTDLMEQIEAEKEEMRQFNGMTINQLYEIGCKLVDLHMERIRKQVASAGDYSYAEDLYLHGDQSGR